MPRLGELLFFGFVFCLLLVASCSAALFESTLAVGFSVNLQSPDDGTTTVDNMPDFKFTVTHPSQLTINCSLWLENATFKGVYAIQNLVANGSLTTLTPTLPIPNGLWQWWINCSDATTSITSEIRTITANVFRGDRNFSASYDGSTRYYWLELPDDFDSSVPTPLVIVLPGYSQDRNGYQTTFPVLRQIFQQNGWMVVSPECRMIDGFYSWYTAPSRSDITDIINRLKQEFNVNSSHIHVMGISMGASGTLKYAMFNPDIVASVCAIYGVSNFTEFFSWTQDLTLYYSILTAYGGTPSQVPLVYNDESPLGNEFRFVHTPVFLLHGSADTLVPVSNSRNLNKSLSQAGYDVKYVEVPGADHDSSTYVGHEQTIYEWFRDHPLSKSPSPTPTPTPTLTPTPTASPTPTTTASPSPTPTNTPTPTPTPTPTLTPIPTPTPTSFPSSIPTATPAITYTPTPTVTPRPTTSATPSTIATPVPLITIVHATLENGATVELTINGNISGLQMSNAVISSNLSASTTTLSFTITGESGTEGLGNFTIPKIAVPYGASPIIYIDGQRAQTQGNSQDANNFYVWYATRFSTHEVSILFAATPNNTYSPSQFQGLPQEVTYVAVITVAIVAIVAVAFVTVRVRKGKIREKITT